MLARVSTLRMRHPTCFDGHVDFFEDTHTYVLKATQKNFPISVTGVVSKFFPVFDGPAIVERYWNLWSTSPKTAYGAKILELRASGLDDAAIKQKIVEDWAAAKDEASDLGTKMHYLFQCALENWWPPGDLVEAFSTELELFNKWFPFFCESRNCTVFRSELMVFYAPNNVPVVAGCVDLVLRRTAPDGGDEFVLVDWKRSKKLISPQTRNNFPNNSKFGSGPYDGFPDTPFEHYSAQLNIYAHLMERCGFRVAELWIVQIHPNVPDPEGPKVNAVQAKLRLGRAAEAVASLTA